MKTYQNPIVEMIELSNEDVIVTSLIEAEAFDFGSDAAGDIWSWNA